MTGRPKVAAFDIIETVFTIEPLRPRLVALGLPSGALETWFASGLRDAFALAATDRFAPFRSVLDGALDEVLTRHGLMSSADSNNSVLDALKELPPHPDAREAFETLQKAGIRIMALSNGAAAATEALLKRADLDKLVERIVSVDEVKLAKPRRVVYVHAAELARVGLGEVALVAAHPWDLHGAKAAGLLAGYVARGKPYPATMIAPDVVGQALAEVAHKFVTLN